MASATNTKVPNPSNPSSLPPRYEIRKLEPHDYPWVVALNSHSNLFHSPLWTTLYPNNLTSRLHKFSDAVEWFFMHQINSGLSWGVFDTEYVFKRDESRATGGKLYWDPNEEGVQEEQGLEAESQRLLEQMDFPLVSIELGYDAVDPLDMNKMGPMLRRIADTLNARDQDLSARTPIARGEVMMRYGTATRRDCQGQGIAAGMARWVMREADALGYRGIQIECVHDALRHIWSTPPQPFKGGAVSEIDTAKWEDEEGKLILGPSKQKITKCFVTLKSSA